MVEEGDTYNGWSFNRTFMELKYLQPAASQ